MELDDRGRPPGRVMARAGLAVSLLITIIVRLPHLRFVPIWDSRNYWDDCLQNALSGRFDPMAFNCSAHRSMLYMLTIAWPQYLVHDSAFVLNLTNLALSLLAVLAFFGIAATLFENGRDAALLTILFSSMPVWTASSLNINPDFGVLVAFLIALYCLLRGRLWWATLAGLFMTLSKEMGLLLWVALVGIDFLFAVSWGRAKRLLMLLPLLAYLLLGRALAARNVPAEWHPGGAPPPETVSLVKTFLSFDPTDETYRAYAADILILNFNWVMTLVIVAWLISVLVSILRRKGLKTLPAVDTRTARYTGLATVAAFYLVTRYPTFNNPRYLLAVFPLFVLVFGMAAIAMIRTPRIRYSIIAAAAILELCSMNATIDPLSRLVFGTFRFGQHDMLRMTSFTDECCGMGRDQLVYNLQFTHFDYVQNKLYETVRPGDHDVLSMAALGPWFFVGQLDARTFHRTLARDGIVRPQLYTRRDWNKGVPLPKTMLYMSFPNLSDAYDLAFYAHWYDIGERHVIEEHGYEVATYACKLRRANGP